MVMDCCLVRLSVKTKGVHYLSEGSSSNHLKDLEVFLVQAHLLYFGSEGFSWREKEEGLPSAKGL